MTKASELREHSDEQLRFQIAEAQKERFNLKFQAATERLNAPSNLRRLRREIARLKTILRERELEREREAATD